MSEMSPYLVISAIDALAAADWYGEPGNHWVTRVYNHHCARHAADFEVCDAAVCVKARAAEVAAYRAMKAEVYP